MSYSLNFYIVYKAFKTNFMKKLNELAFQNHSSAKFPESGKSIKKVRNSKKIVFEYSNQS